MAGASSAHGPILQVTVIGHGEDGSNILHSDFATLKLFTNQPLPTGTNLDVEVQLAPTVKPGEPTFGAISLPPLPSAAPEDFTYLTQAINQLQMLDPATARALLQQLPEIGPNFTSGLLFFLTAVKSGDIRPLLAPRTVSRLDSLSPGTLGRMSKDIGELHQQFVDSPLDDWKGVTLPFVFGSEVQPARLYIRKEDESGAAADKNAGGQRFVLDVSFSQLGELQFDGFVRHGTPKSLELYMRSHEPLDSALSQDISGIFTQAIETTGLRGHLQFQHGPEHFVKPQTKLPERPINSGAHTILA